MIMGDVVISRMFEKGKEKITLFRKHNTIYTDYGKAIEIVKKMKYESEDKNTESVWSNFGSSDISIKELHRIEEILKNDMDYEASQLKKKGWVEK